MMLLRFEVYKSENSEARWRLYNGSRIVADSGESYKRRTVARTQIEKFCAKITAGEFKIVDKFDADDPASDVTTELKRKAKKADQAKKPQRKRKETAAPAAEPKPERKSRKRKSAEAAAV
jgi:uncharacterized protein YegP (UPF0339 family)